MATVVGALNIQMGLNTSKFTSGTKKVTSGLSGIGKASTFAKGKIAAFAGALGVGLLIKRFKDLVVEQLKVVDAMAKMSDRTGFAMESLAALSLAAKLSGTETDTLNRALEIFTKRIGEVALGTGEAKIGFEALGLSVDEMLKLSAIERFKKVADEIARLGTEAEQAAVSNLLFGRSGAGLVNLFNAGSEAIAKAAAETERFGTAISRLDAAKIEEANDAMTRLGELLDGIIRQITIELAPALEAFTESLVAAQEAGGGFGAVFTFVLKGLTVLWEVLNAGMQLSVALLAAIGGGMIRLIRLIPGLSGELETLDSILKEIAEASFEQAMEAADRVIAILEGVSESADKAHTSIDRLDEFFRRGGPGQLFGASPISASEFDQAFQDFLAEGIEVKLKPGRDFFEDAIEGLTGKGEEIGKDISAALLGDNRALVRGSTEAVSFLRQQQRRQPLKGLEQIAKEQLKEIKGVKEAVENQAPPPPVAILGGAV